MRLSETDGKGEVEMSPFDYMFLTIICALNLSVLIVATVLINHIDDRTCDIKQALKELKQMQEDR